MRIAFDINGTIRDTFLKAEQLYQKFYIDEYEEVYQKERENQR